MADKTFSPVRARASSVEAALAQALQMTGASRDEIEFEVLEETAAGAVVRIMPIGTLNPKTENAASVVDEIPSSDEAVNEAGSTPEADFQVAETFEEEAVEVDSDEVDSDEVDSDEVDSDEVDSDEVDSDEVDSGETDSIFAAETESEEDDSVELSADDVSESSDAEIAAESTPAAVVGAAREAPAIRQASPEVIEHARVLAQEMLERMSLEAEAKVADLPVWCLPTSHDKSERVRDVPRAFLQIEGEDVGILIGKHGQTLQSFQYLLNLSLNNTTESEEASEDGVRNGGVHVIVDAGDYRGRRAGALERAAHEAAERAKRDRRAIRMEPMPGHERRLVHLALYDDKEITTSSDGREPWRRVVVTPAGVRPPRGEERGEGGRYNERSGGGNRQGGRGNGGASERSGDGFGGNRDNNRGGGGRSGGFNSNSGSAGGGRRSYN